MVYFILPLLANSKGWSCWSHACGFFLMAFPQILFVATFLLLLSFWVDLCHQANDVEEDEDDYVYQLLLEKSKNREGVQHVEGRRKFFPVLVMRLGSRQKIVILVTLFMLCLAIATAVLVWVGMGKNPIDSSFVARVYLDLFAAVMLALAGGLTCYGSLLFSKMSKVRSERASSEIRKVAGLATVSVVCFTICALVALVTDIPVWNDWHSKNADAVYISLIILYYLIGSSVPSSTVLWVMRDMPSRPIVNISPPSPVTITTDRRMSSPPQRWITSTSAQNQVLRASPI